MMFINMPAPAPAEPTTKPGTREREKEKGPWNPTKPRVNPTPKA